MVHKIIRRAAPSLNSPLENPVNTMQLFHFLPPPVVHVHRPGTKARKPIPLAISVGVDQYASAVHEYTN